MAVLAIAAFLARSVALAGFGLDSLIEIFASLVVVWEFTGSGTERRDRALMMIDSAFYAMALYIVLQGVFLLLGLGPQDIVPVSSEVSCPQDIVPVG